MTPLAPRGVVLATAVACMLAGCRRDPATWSGEGDLLAVEEPGPWLTIEHDDIPDLPLARTARLLARSSDVARSVAPGIRVRFDLARDGERLVVTRLDRLGPARGPGQPEVEDRPAHHGGVVGSYLAGPGAGWKTARRCSAARRCRAAPFSTLVTLECK